jgi:hypothetical protein
MKFIISVILTALLSFAACLYLPWWSIAIVSFGVAFLIPQNPWKAFSSAFFALFLLWGCLSFWISYNNQHLLAHKISLLILQLDEPYLLILITALIGALVSGLSALSGSFLRKSK